MDKIKQYRNIIHETLEHQATFQASDMPDVYNQLIVSQDERHFLLLVLGWHKKKYIYNIVAHLELQDDKVWIHEDRTDTGIATLLEEKGIAGADIILGYAEPYSLPDEVTSS